MAALLTRRGLLGGLGGAAFAILAGRDAAGAGRAGLAGLPHHPPRAKRVVYLFQSGGPSQLETFDYKPRLRELHGQALPDSVRNGQRLTTMTSGAPLNIRAPLVDFARRGESGQWVSDLLPHTARIADRLCVVRSAHTEEINHDPGMTLLLTGSNRPGRASLGAWLSYGLGSLSDELPSFVVISARNTYPEAQPLYTRLWGSGFLPAEHQGVQLRGSSEPVSYLRDPSAPSERTTRRMAAALRALNEMRGPSPEIDARMASYELAFRMQTSVPSVSDLSGEPARTFELYGPDSRTPGSFAASCLLARRLLERGVRTVMVCHRSWDHHTHLMPNTRTSSRETDQGSAALVTDLAERGLLEDTLVVWAGEFGRTVYAQGDMADEEYGRDHHGRCFSLWLAGAGIEAGTSYGESDDFSYNVAESPLHVHDLNATILHLMGIDHTKLTFEAQGRAFRLTDVSGEVAEGLLGS